MRPSLWGPRIGKPREGLEVREGLTTLDPPGPLAADRRRETQLQQGVEALVGVREHAAEQPVDLVVGDGRERGTADEVDVADLVDAEGDAVHPGVLLQQVARELGLVLVRAADDEGLDEQAVVAEDEPGLRRQLVDTGQGDEVGTLAGPLVGQPALVQRCTDEGVEPGALRGRRRAAHRIPTWDSSSARRRWASSAPA